MRFSTSLALTLPVLAAAEQQVPLADKVRGWINKATNYVSAAAPSVTGNPIKAAAGKAANAAVHDLTLENWRSIVKPSPAAAHQGPEEWMIFLDGGNKTCYGLCANASAAWNVAAPILAASPNPPKLARIDCDGQQILCNTWAAGPPSVYHMLLPAPLPDQSKPATTIHWIGLNRSSSVTHTAKVITEIHTKETYKQKPVYEGYFHPFDGIVQKLGLDLPLAYVFWGFSLMPSWLPMIAISLFSRVFM
ncbi:hypothetical protein W97_03930 [Coniosporium apollinis CBS 100218]|uniref:Uncharacterized protein n=1 Tax=Coniosporium apollinis (strain CBS 100218) TaxID=1168221 RepID=R7YRZ6_CONA1|nr:uncharacterized protein W97_03930 [Coniosporium apollinis CBS 100218]EON64697.1 hypothetical protein W97_03930 [Coniosporium apollinis CBS 100218]